MDVDKPDQEPDQVPDDRPDDRPILESLPVPVWEVEAETLQLIYRNAAAARALGAPARAGAAPAEWASRFGPEHESLLALLRDVRTDGLTRRLECALDFPSEGERCFETVIQVSRRDGDRARALTGVMLDVTDRRQTTLEQKAAARAREDLLAIVSHDLRNPLGVVLASSALLLKGPLPPDKEERARRQIEAIQRAGNRMNRLIRDLLDFASIQNQQLIINARPCSVRQLVRDVVQAMQPLAAQKSLRLIDELDDAGGDVDDEHRLPVQCDRERLLQALTNVVGNAIKFTPEGGQVSVRAEPKGDMIHFVVADTGPGLTDDELRNVFDRRWQAERRNREGIGLGLPIVKGIVDAHGGRVWAENRAAAGAGDGATGASFYLAIPAVLPE